jgi:DNA-binding NarL/FixJ family response regulator
MSRLPTVLLADDHAVFTDGLASLLRPSYEIVGSVRDGRQLLEAADRLHPDVIVADVSMPAMSGLDALRRLRERRSHSRAILLTMHADPRLAAEALRAGAAGFVLKEATGDELLTAIKEVLAGRTYLTPAITADVVALMSNPKAVSGVRLTPRQHEILELIVDGRRAKEIAQALDLSPRTVETVKAELMRALNVHSTAGLVRYALEHRLVHTPGLADRHSFDHD